MFAITLLFLWASFMKCNAAFFDYTDFDDPLNYLWNARNQVLTEPNTACFGNVGNVRMEGVCKSRTECQLTGGISTGGLTGSSCGLLSTCCVYMGNCGSKLSAKVSYFISSRTNFEQNCIFQVKPHNRNICQLRLDFVDLSLAPPAQTEPSLGSCRDERFYVEGYPDIPQICGKNSGQHIYIPVNGNDTNSVRLHLDLISNPMDMSSSIIRVNQLQCPGTKVFPHRNNMFQMMADFTVLAPEGCLQYYLEPRGTFKSFGFDSLIPTASSYSINQNYAICFKRPRNICGIRYIIDYFTLADAAAGSDATDYLYIPGVAGDTQRIAGVQAANQVFISNAPGPFYVYFVSDNQFVATTDIGFNIRYDLAAVCP